MMGTAVNRREFLKASAASALLVAPLSKSFAQSDPFSTLFAELTADPQLAASAIEFRDFALEGAGDTCTQITINNETTCIVTAARRPPRLPPSTLAVSSAAKELIVYYEVTSRKKYEKELMAPTWPGGASGVTVGIGYDLGYVDEDDLTKEWGAYVHPFVLKRLSSVTGLTGKKANEALSSVKNVQVSWDSAYGQFTKVLLPIFIAQTEKFAKNLDQLSEDSRGAIVSLVFNRGTALKLKNDPVDSRREMREVANLMANKDFAPIPAKLREMKRLWDNKPDARGVSLRREAEARLFERGLRKS